MSSYRTGQPTGLTQTRLAGDLLLGSRAAAAKFTHRHPNLIRRKCQPIACDVGTRAVLYDLDEVDRQLADTPRRYPALT